MCCHLFQVNRVLLWCLLYGTLIINLFDLNQILDPPVVYSFGREEVDLAIKYLENLTKVPRFDMLIMCLSSTEKAGMFMRMFTFYTFFVIQIPLECLVPCKKALFFELDSRDVIQYADWIAIEQIFSRYGMMYSVMRQLQ